MGRAERASRSAHRIVFLQGFAGIQWGAVWGGGPLAAPPPSPHGVRPEGGAVDVYAIEGKPRLLQDIIVFLPAEPESGPHEAGRELLAADFQQIVAFHHRSSFSRWILKRRTCSSTGSPAPRGPRGT